MYTFVNPFQICMVLQFKINTWKAQHTLQAEQCSKWGRRSAQDRFLGAHDKALHDSLLK